MTKVQAPSLGSNRTESKPGDPVDRNARLAVLRLSQENWFAASR